MLELVVCVQIWKRLINTTKVLSKKVIDNIQKKFEIRYTKQNFIAKKMLSIIIDTNMQLYSELIYIENWDPRIF